MKTHRFIAVSAAVGLVLSVVSATEASAARLGVEAGSWGWAQGWSSLPASVGGKLFHGTVRSFGHKVVKATVVLFGVFNATTRNPGPTDRPLVRTATDSTGAWRLSVPPGTDLAPYSDNGVANFEIVSFDGRGSDVYFASATTMSSVPSSSATVAKLGKKTVGLSPDDSSSIILNSDKMPHRGLATATARDSIEPADNPTSVSCDDSDFSYYPNTAVKVAATYSDGTGDYFDLSYSEGASSSLGVAVSVGNGFTQSGKTSKSSTSTQGFPKVKGAVDRAYFTYFTYEAYQHHCVEVQRGQVIDEWSVRIYKPKSYDGGDKITKTSTIKAGNCIPEHKGGHFLKEKTRATEFSTGAKTSGAIGINLSADTGYSTDTKIDVWFPKTGHLLCGLHAMPGGNAGLLQIHSTVVG